MWTKQRLKSMVESLCVNQKEGKINQGGESRLKIQSSQQANGQHQAETLRKSTTASSIPMNDSPKP